MSESAHGGFCVVVPAYMEQGRIGAVVRHISRYCADVIVIDDGSSDATFEEASSAGATVLKHDGNKGKGIALNTGFAYAREQGYEFLITMDADGQHDPEDLRGFVDEYKKSGTPVLIGNRMGNTKTMPFIRLLTNWFMSLLLSRMMGQRVPDTQSGYRLYRCDVLEGLELESPRFAAESEILLFLAGRGVKIGSVPMRVIYRDEKSKINPFRDTIRFFGMLRRFRKRGKE